MWVPSRLVELFQISKDTVNSLQNEVAVLKAERDLLRDQLNMSKNSFEWIRSRVNQLEMERAQLIKKAYNIDLPVPEIARTQSSIINFDASLFQDVGDEKAKELGLPIYGN